MNHNTIKTLHDYIIGIEWLGKTEDVEAEALFLLVDRDVIQDNMYVFSDEQKFQIALSDQSMKNKSNLFASVLPAPSSTPQAKAEGRWWWFLNEA